MGKITIDENVCKGCEMCVNACPKKIIALALAVCILLGMTSVHAEGTDKYNRLTVGTTTPFSGNFLKEALLHVPEDKPYRGPEKYVNGDYTYSCSAEGDYNWFQGRETISYRGEQIYECVYHGGLIR